MSSAPKTVHVNEALAKLKFLAGDRTASERGGYRPNWQTFGARIAEVRRSRGLPVPDKLDNYRNTLESAAKNDRIDADTEQIIAELCRIDIRSSAWRDADAKAFKAEFEGVQFERVKLGGWSIAPEISVELLFSPQRASPEWPADIDIVCQPATISEVGQTITITRAKLALAWDEAATPETCVPPGKVREQLIEEKSADLRKIGITVDVIGKTQSPAWWFTNVKGEKIGILSIAGFCTLGQITDKLTVEARLVVEDRDLRAEDAPESTTTDGAEDPIRQRDGQPLGTNKRKVLQAITVRSLKHDAKQGAGSAILAVDRVQFKKR